jgi:tetratricopeptide (TPR) repeat protein
LVVPEFVRRGRELNERGAHLEAVKVCRLGLLAHPSQLDGRLILGAALLALGRYDEVLAEMRVALELDGLNGTAMTLKGEALLGRGDHRQALDVLEKAARYDAANPRVEFLMAQAQEGVATGGPPGLGDADTSISWTKNYPGYRSSSEATLDPTLDPDSTRTTLPGGDATEIEPVGHRFDPPGAAGDLLATADTAIAAATDVEESSINTMEIDPELEGVEIFGGVEADLDDVAFGGPTIMDATGELDDDPSMELSSSDLMPAMPELEPPKVADDVRGFDEGFGAAASDPTHGYRGRPDRPERFDEPYTTPDESLDFEAPLFLDSDPDRPKSTSFPTDLPRASGRPPRPLEPPPQQSGPVLEALFPEDEDGVSKLEIIDDETGMPRSFDKQPHRGSRPLPASLGPARGEDTRERRRTADMRMIREGLGLTADPSGANMPRPAAAQLPAAGPVPRRPREAPPTSVVAQRAGTSLGRGGGPRLSLLAVVVLAVVLLGGGVAGGMVLRGWRTQRQLDAAAERARQLIQTGNYLDHLRAAALLDRTLELRDRAGLRALRARVEAATADEFGVAGRATEMVEALGDDDSLDATIARVQLALFRGRVDEAARGAGALTERFSDEPVGGYLRGRSQLERGQLEPAKGAFESVNRPGSTPLYTARLAEVHRLSGRYAAALALVGSDDLPAMAIARARAMAGAGELESADQPEAELESLIADGEKSPASQTTGVSPRQLALARLALVEVSLARGKPEEARPHLAALAEFEARDGPFLAAYAEALVAAGDNGAAAAAHAKLAELWPKNPRTAILAARLALRAGDTRAARAAIEGIASPEKLPRALAVRGELALEAGRLDDAIKDLDAAIAANPGLIDASLARARVDLARNKPDEALDRLDKLPAAFGRERDIVRARAFRQAGKVDRARQLLDKLAAAGFVPALLEMARLEHKSGKFAESIKMYARVLELEPKNPIAVLEQANLLFEEGDPRGADARLDELVKARPNDARVLLASARIKSLMGDPGKAGERVDEAEKIAGTPRSLVDRERGRSLLRRSRFEEATRAFEAATEADPTDGESWLLLMEVILRERDAGAAAAVLKKATMPLENNSYMLALLRGMEAIASDQLERALRDFQTATVVAKNTATRFERARLFYWQGRVQEALGELGAARTSLSRAVKLDPRHADAYLMLGEVEFQDRNRRAAVANYRKSAQLDPIANPTVHFYLGELNLEDRRFKQAVESLEQYLELVPTGQLSGEAKRLLALARGK